jgi:succinyl-diaminopimelate desuccinylase
LRFNVRYNDGWTPESLEAAIREGIADVDAQGTEIAFTVAATPSRSFLSPLGEAVELLDTVIAEQTGEPPQHSTGGGTSDARFIVQYCSVVECGLPGPSMHQVDEHVAVADVEALTALYAAFIARYFETAPK